MKKHGQAWNKLATVGIMNFSQDDGRISFACRIVDATAAGDWDEALWLIPKLERELTDVPDAATEATRECPRLRWRCRLLCRWRANRLYDDISPMPDQPRRRTA
jgi:hypothetical protein